MFGLSLHRVNNFRGRERMVGQLGWGVCGNVSGGNSRCDPLGLEDRVLRKG